LPKLAASALAGVIAATLAAPPAASADPVAVGAVRCVAGPGAACPASDRPIPAARMQLDGSGLQAARGVVFRGGPGAADDVFASVGQDGPERVELLVPPDARSGPLDVLTHTGRTVTAARRVRLHVPDVDADVFFTGDDRRPGLRFEADAAGTVIAEVVDATDGSVVRSIPVETQTGLNRVEWDGRDAPEGRYLLRIAGGEAGPPFALRDHVFPIRGRHDLGRTFTNGFGGGRSHRGQDMFAACGTPIVAARGGRVREVGFEGASGHYVVITDPAGGREHVYMHLQSEPSVREGERVTTRQRIGAVGDSGNAWGCHLHFELWTAPGWFRGGHAIDPIRHLQAWDAWS
jgi:murein DD-endopeptidase MepM/ murein hydrolase activator NlpD